MWIGEWNGWITEQISHLPTGALMVHAPRMKLPGQPVSSRHLRLWLHQLHPEEQASLQPSPCSLFISVKIHVCRNCSHLIAVHSLEEVRRRVIYPYVAQCSFALHPSTECCCSGGAFGPCRLILNCMYCDHLVSVQVTHLTRDPSEPVSIAWSLMQITSCRKSA